MELFGGMLLKHRIVLAIILLTTLTGCSVVDVIRPDINRDGQLRLDPLEIEYQFEDGEHIIYSGGSGSSAADRLPPEVTRPVTGTTTSGRLVLDATNFEPLGESIVDSGTYTQYLREEVITPVKETLNQLDSDSRNKLYFRVMHAGYDVRLSDGVMFQGTPLDDKTSGNFSTYAGEAMREFGTQYLNSISSLNANTERDALYTAQKYLKSISADTLSDSAHVTDAIDDKGRPIIRYNYYNMWNSSENSSLTFGEFKEKFESDLVSVMPHLMYRYYNTGGSQVSLTFNAVNSHKVYPFNDEVATSLLDRIFCKTNPYANRYVKTMEDVYVNDSETLWFHVDGYTKTLVYMSCTSDTTLPMLLGDEYNNVSSILNSVRPVTDLTLLDDYEGGRIVQAGSKGVN